MGIAFALTVQSDIPTQPVQNQVGNLTVEPRRKGNSNAFIFEVSK